MKTNMIPVDPFLQQVRMQHLLTPPEGITLTSLEKELIDTLYKHNLPRDLKLQMYHDILQKMIQTKNKLIKPYGDKPIMVDKDMNTHFMSKKSTNDSTDEYTGSYDDDDADADENDQNFKTPNLSSSLERESSNVLQSSPVSPRKLESSLLSSPTEVHNQKDKGEKKARISFHSSPINYKSPSSQPQQQQWERPEQKTILSSDNVGAEAGKTDTKRFVDSKSTSREGSNEKKVLKKQNVSSDLDYSPPTKRAKKRKASTLATQLAERYMNKLNFNHDKGEYLIFNEVERRHKSYTMDNIKDAFTDLHRVRSDTSFQGLNDKKTLLYGDIAKWMDDNLHSDILEKFKGLREYKKVKDSSGNIRQTATRSGKDTTRTKLVHAKQVGRGNKIIKGRHIISKYRKPILHIDLNLWNKLIKND